MDATELSHFLDETALFRRRIRSIRLACHPKLIGSLICTTAQAAFEDMPMVRTLNSCPELKHLIIDMGRYQSYEWRYGRDASAQSVIEERLDEISGELREIRGLLTFRFHIRDVPDAYKVATNALLESAAAVIISTAKEIGHNQLLKMWQGKLKTSKPVS